MSIPTPPQVGAPLTAADDRFAALIAICALGGLRLGEAAALQAGDVDFLRRRMAISRQIQRGPGGTAELRAPEHGSERTIVVPDRLLTLEAGHVERHLPVGGPERWLFPTPTGTPPHQDTVGRQWRKATSAAGLTGLRLHDLRHFFASGRIASGCDLVTVQRALGHASATTTLTTHGHPWPDAEDRTRAATDGPMSAALDDPADSLRTGRR